MNSGSNGREPTDKSKLLPIKDVPITISGDTNQASGIDNKQNFDEDESNYSNVAAKTVANIRRLQENVMSVSVTTSPSGGPSSPKESSQNDLCLQGKHDHKHSYNVSKVSINRSISSNMTIHSEELESLASGNALQNVDEVVSPGNDPSASGCSFSLSTAHLNSDLTSKSSANMVSPASTSSNQIHQGSPCHSPSRSKPNSPGHASINEAGCFFSAVSPNQQALQENEITGSLNPTLQQQVPSNNEMVASRGEVYVSNATSSPTKSNNSNSSDLYIANSDEVNGPYESRHLQSASGSVQNTIGPALSSNKSSVVLNDMQKNVPCFPNSSNLPKSPSSLATNSYHSVSNSCSSSARSSLPVISNELTSSFNALVTIDPNWQSTKNSVRERNAVMCNNAVMADVWFNVGSETLLQQIQQQQQFEFRNKQRSHEGATQNHLSRNSSVANDQVSSTSKVSSSTNCSSSSISSTTHLSSALPRKIPGHKYVLATGSTVFYAMFYGGLAMDIENGSSPDNAIDVPDVEPTAFLTMLKYLYCDDIDLTPDNVLPTLYAAKKYIVPYLAQECVRFLESSLSARNACLLLSQARFFDEPALTQRAWEVIDAQAQLALTSDGFVDIDKETLKLILARETLNCRETVIFDAAKRWAQAECVRNDIQNESIDEHEAESGMEASSNDQTKSQEERWRDALGEALYLVRFLCMSVQEFADTVAKSGLLTLQETTDIFLYFTASTSQKPLTMGSFLTTPRTGLARQICARFGSSQYRTNQWRYRGRTDSIQFCVDRRIFIVGFGLYGSSNGSSEYRAHIELKSSPAFAPLGRGSRVLAENTVKFFSDGSSNSFQVYFKQPVQIEPEIYYTASAVLDGAELSYFGQEGRSEVTVGRATFQFQYSSESTNGTGVQGGQIPEIIFYGPTPGPKSTPNSTPIQHRHSVQPGISSNSSESNNSLDPSNQVSNSSLNNSSNFSRNSSNGTRNVSSSNTSSSASKVLYKDIAKQKE